MRNSFCLLVFLFVIGGCSSSKKSGQEVHNNLNLNDWSGTYQGVLPCADCGGINTTLILNQDKTFRLETHYLDVEDDDNFVSEGSFDWDEKKQIVTLNTGTDDASANQYLLDDNQLFKLNSKGKVVKGSLSEMYILKKLDKSLFGTKFVLSNLNDKSIASTQVFITFDENMNRFYGNSGCNLMNGSFVLNNRNKLKLSQIISTKKACPEMELETQFLAMLHNVNAFEFKGDSLIFKDGSSVLSVFVSAE